MRACVGVGVRFECASISHALPFYEKTPSKMLRSLKFSSDLYFDADMMR